MLLINGMPVIHIELKKSGIPVSQAYNQIEKYSHEGIFSGLFSLVQIFVAMEPNESVYFANPGPDGKFNPDYYFHWADFNNEPINEWDKVASTLLSIPMAHQLIGFYTVADDSDGVLKVMRSYQYFAASAISDKVLESRAYPLGSFFILSWEQRKLGELADIVGGGTPSTGVSDFWDGDIDWYAPAEIAEQIYLTSSQRKITEEGYNHSSAKMLPVGTVLFTSRAGIGKTAILTRKGCTNQGFQSIVPHKGELDSYFIFSRTEELKQYGETVGAGSTFVEVSGKQMANMELMMPKTMAEQKIMSLERLIV